MFPYKKDTNYVTTDDDKNLEINRVTYDKSDGKGEDKVTQIKDADTNKEIGHKTEHPDGQTNYHGDYKDYEDYTK
jgi:hypothetical protein